MNGRELHRVWVVEATLKSGLRQLYAKRRFYLDADSWAVLSADQYDARGNLWRINFVYQTPMYELPAGSILMQGSYNFLSGIYTMQGDAAEFGGIHTKRPEEWPNFWSAQALSASGVL